MKSEVQLTLKRLNMTGRDYSKVCPLFMQLLSHFDKWPNLIGDQMHLLLLRITCLIKFFGQLVKCMQINYMTGVLITIFS